MSSSSASRAPSPSGSIGAVRRPCTPTPGSGPAPNRSRSCRARRAERPGRVGQPAFHVGADRLVLVDGNADVVDDPFAIQLADRRDRVEVGQAAVVDHLQERPHAVEQAQDPVHLVGNVGEPLGQQPVVDLEDRVERRHAREQPPPLVHPAQRLHQEVVRRHLDRCPCAGCSSTRRRACPTTSRTGGRRRRAPTAGRPRRRRRAPAGSRSRRARPRRPSPARRPTSGWRRSRAADRRAARPRSLLTKRSLSCADSSSRSRSRRCSSARERATTSCT